MAENVPVCTIDDSLRDKMKKFRFRKETNNAAIIMKVEKDSRTIVIEDELEDVTIEEVAADLPESQPRYVLFSFAFAHGDGRTSYPLVFIFVSPQGCKPEQQMMYAGSKKYLVQQAQLTKVFEIRNTEDLTEEWLKEKISFFT